MKRKLIISGIVVFVIAIITIIIMNIKVSNGSVTDIVCSSGTDFAGCIQTNYLNSNPYDIYDVSVMFTGNLVNGRVDVYLVNGKWIDTENDNVIKHYEFKEKGEFQLEDRFDIVEESDEYQYIVIGSENLDIKDFIIVKTSKVRLIDDIIPRKIELIDPENI